MKGLRELVTDIDHLKSLEKLKKVNQVKLFLEQRILTGLVNASRLTQNDQSTKD